MSQAVSPPGVRKRPRGTRTVPEDSVPLRALVLAIVLVSVVAVIAQGAVDGFTALVAPLLIPVGFVFTHRRRHRRNTGAKVFLAVALLAALGAFLQRVRSAGSVDDARAALASLFVWVQVLHSFDLPRRRDLAFSVVASLLLMAEAGSLSLGSGFAAFLVPYAILAGGWLYLSHRSEAAGSAAAAVVRTERPPAARGGRAAVGRSLAVSMAVILGATTVAFMSLPRLPGTIVVAPPMALGQRVAVPGFNGAVVNPGLPSRPGSGPVGFAPLAYPGYGQSLDLRARGHLSDRVVLKVRAPQAAFWRAQAYDTFNGTTWTASHTDTQSVPAGWGQPFVVPRPPETSPAVPVRQIVQTFYVLGQQPNVVFSAYEPRQVYFPASTLRVDDYASIRSPILLEAGLVYSVVSRIPVTSPRLLRSAPPAWDPAILNQYTQLPSNLPDRVIRLARQITDPAPTTYDKVMAVQRWLQVHTRYNLDIPPDPPGVDAVDYFLFERRQGFCEHFSSAMAILLRAVGIPTRFTVGFGPGERNLFTGYYEVREADAHSWVEVDYPGIGWVEYDPTHQVPDAAPGLSGRFITPQVIAAIGRFLARVVPGPVKRFAGTVRGAVVLIAGLVAGVLPWVAVTALLMGAAIVARRQRRRRAARGPPPSGATAAFVSLCRSFERRGLPRPPDRTPSEHLSRILGRAELPSEARDDVVRIVRTFERQRYSGTKPPESDVREALQAAARVARR